MDKKHAKGSGHCPHKKTRLTVSSRRAPQPVYIVFSSSCAAKEEMPHSRKTAFFTGYSVFLIFWVFFRVFLGFPVFLFLLSYFLCIFS